MSGDDDLYLTFDQTVPRRLAHRQAVSEVFVTDSAEGDEHEFYAALQVPRSHLLWGDREPSHHDPLALVEACRQATFVISHRHLRVPVGPVFILRDIGFDVTDIDRLRDVGGSPLDAVVRVRVTAAAADDVMAGFTFDGVVSVGGQPAMELGGEITFVEPDQYGVIRAFGTKPGDVPHRPDLPALPPRLRGRMDDRNVVVGAPSGGDGDRRFPLVIDQRHPSFYDHPLDHVPGSLLIEAARQAALASIVLDGHLDRPQGMLTSFHSSFDRFAEHHTHLECATAVRPAAGNRFDVGVTFRQDGEQIAEGTATIDVP